MHSHIRVRAMHSPAMVRVTARVSVSVGTSVRPSFVKVQAPHILVGAISPMRARDSGQVV